LALSGAFLTALLAAGCGDEGPSPEPPPPPVTDPETLGPYIRTNSGIHPEGFETGLYVDRSFWVDEESSRRTTVRATLIALGASMADGKVVDAAGEELYFFWHQHPDSKDYKHYRSDVEEVRELEKKYHVVRMFPEKFRDRR
jgi:hypothetical protein